MLGPVAGAQIFLGLRQFAHGAEREAQRGVGDLFVQHVRRVGDDDPVLAGPFGVDMVVADAEARHDLQLGKRRHDGAVDRTMTCDRRDGADLRRDFGDECLPVRCCKCFVHREAARRQHFFDDRLGAEHHHIGFFAGHRSLSSGTSGSSHRGKSRKPRRVVAGSPRVKREMSRKFVAQPRHAAPRRPPRGRMIFCRPLVGMALTYVRPRTMSGRPNNTNILGPCVIREEMNGVGWYP